MAYFPSLASVARKAFARPRAEPSQSDSSSSIDGADTVLDEFETDWDDLSGLQVLDGELIETTADDAQAPVGALLARVRDALGLDAVFVSQMVGGRRLIRNAACEGESDPLEEAYCLQLVSTRATGAAVVAVPVAGADGRIYGTLGAAVGDAAEPLRRVARLVASTLEQGAQAASAPRRH